MLPTYEQCGIRHGIEANEKREEGLRLQKCVHLVFVYRLQAPKFRAFLDPSGKARVFLES